MRIGIYLDPVSPTAAPGGAAYCACLLALHLEARHDVDLLHHRANFSTDLLNRTFGLQMERTRVQYCEPVNPGEQRSGRMPWNRYRAARQSRSQLSAGYDAFVAFVHGPPPFCHADNSVLVILFPVFRRQSSGQGRGRVKAALFRAYDAIEWQGRFNSYRHRFAISAFAADWTERRWNVRCGILHPPVNLVDVGAKEHLILSVGRFTAVKRQLEMVTAFRETAQTLPRDWSYVCAGGVDSSTDGLAYFARVSEAAAGAPVRFCCDINRAELAALYGRAKIFWHAMGYQDDIARFPERMEHFGIVTAEAMSAGCVPLVFDGGGQAELVRHGIDGFRWKTIDELHRYTQRLVEDDTVCTAMSRAAAIRARQFDKSVYLAGLTRLIEGRP
jgi:glycosyltransferase involved in cell wall biosynthesis